MSPGVWGNSPRREFFCSNIDLLARGPWSFSKSRPFHPLVFVFRPTFATVVWLWSAFQLFSEDKLGLFTQQSSEKNKGLFQKFKFHLSVNFRWLVFVPKLERCKLVIYGESSGKWAHFEVCGYGHAVVPDDRSDTNIDLCCGYGLCPRINVISGTQFVVTVRDVTSWKRKLETLHKLFSTQNLNLFGLFDYCICTWKQLYTTVSTPQRL